MQGNLMEFSMDYAGMQEIPASYAFPAIPILFPNSFFPFEVSGITDIQQARQITASKNHKEAERRRRERINSHLNKLRTLLPCNSKTDKASLLAKVIQHVKELKEQASEISENELFPTESDEITVLPCEYSKEGRLIFKASFCCEDRTDLLQDLIETLKSLKLKILKAEMSTLGGRVRSVLLISCGEEEDYSEESIGLIQNALRSVVEKPVYGERSKRQKVVEDRHHYHHDIPIDI